MPSRKLNAIQPWLTLPIQAGAPVLRLKIDVDGQPVRDIGIEAAIDSSADWWGSIDISRWRGKEMELSVEGDDGDFFLSTIEQSAVQRFRDDLYSEPLRPLIHFTAPNGWLNDPNGLCYYKGEYHQFYQHCPFGNRNIDSHWGHSVSADLTHWTNLGIAIEPYDGGAIWSGSAVVDWNNTSGLSKNGEPPLVLFYTHAKAPFTQCIAYSNDGRTFERYDGNPVVENMTPQNRDPKVFWHEPSRKWVMAVYVGFPESVHQGQKKEPIRQTLQFYTSPNLIDWTHTSEIGGFYECPDVFPLALDGDPANIKWIAMGANLDYKVGEFDGKNLRTETSLIKGLFGRGLYAPQTFNDIPADDGRRIQVGWLQPRSPGMPFSQSLGTPLELRLVTTGAGPRLTWRPVAELAKRRDGAAFAPRTPHTIQDTPVEYPGSDAMDISLTIRPNTGSRFVITVNGVPIAYDLAAQALSVGDIGGRSAPLHLGKVDIRVIADRDVLEVFAAGGLMYITYPVEPIERTHGVELSAPIGSVDMLEYASYKLA